MANGLLIGAILIFSFSLKAESPPMPPGRSPGMEIGRPPEESLADLKFTYNSKNDLFKDEKEASDYQALFDQNKDSKEIKDHFAKVQEERKSKMEEMRKSGTRPDFLKMKEEREMVEFDLIKAIKSILDTKKKDKATIAKADKADVKCEAAKAQPVLEKAMTDSMKDSAKVTKIILTEEEYKRMKADLRSELKSELKEELKKEMAQNMAKGPREFEKDSKEDREKERPSKDKEDDRPKMAENKSRSGQRSERMGMTQQMSGFQNMGQSGGMQMGNMNQMQYGNMNQMQMGNMNQMQMGNMNQMQMGNMNQMQMGNMNQMQMGNMNQMQYGNGNQMFYGNSQMSGMSYGMQNGNQMQRMPRPQMMRGQSHSYANQMNMGGYVYGNDRLQMNPFPSNMSGYNFMAADANYGYNYGNTAMNPYVGQNSYYATYGSQIGIPYAGMSSFSQMGN